MQNGTYQLIVIQPENLNNLIEFTRHLIGQQRLIPTHK